MRDPELVARAGYAAARLEQAWERWRMHHGLDGSADPLASYVGYSHKEPMGQPRVVIGVDAAEAEFFADFLESHDCTMSGGALGADPGAGLPAADTRPVNVGGRLAVNGHPRPSASGALYPPVSGPQPVMVNGSHPAEASAAAARSAAAGPGPALAPRDVPPEPMVRLLDDTDPSARPVGAEHPATSPQAAPAPAPVNRVFPAPVPTFTPIGETGPTGYNGDPGPADHRGLLDPSATPQDSPDVMAAELAGWASGELPGQASEQMASWAAADGPGARALNRSRSAR
jgi:hypothetical protein